MLKKFYQLVVFGSFVFCSTIFYNSANANQKTYLPFLQNLSAVCKDIFFESGEKQTYDIPCILSNAGGRKDSLIIHYPEGDPGASDIITFLENGEIIYVFALEPYNVLTGGTYQRKVNSIIINYPIDEGFEYSLEIPINPKFSWE